MVEEEPPESRSAVRDRSPHFPVFPEFQGASYLKRYDILCQRLGFRAGLPSCSALPHRFAGTMEPLGEISDGLPLRHVERRPRPVKRNMAIRQKNFAKR